MRVVLWFGSQNVMAEKKEKEKKKGQKEKTNWEIVQSKVSKSSVSATRPGPSMATVYDRVIRCNSWP